MKCKNCPALKCDGFEYPEYYCSIYPEDDCVDFDDGTEGCYHPLNAIKKALKPQAYVYYRIITEDAGKTFFGIWIAYDMWDNEIARAYSKRDCISFAKKAGYTPNICTHNINDVICYEEV